MYFSLLPNISYDQKPISYPFSSSDYILAKNFFRKNKISNNMFGYATFYKKYTMQQNISIEEVARQYYGSPYYDWVIILTNNLINPKFDVPQDEWTLRKMVEHKYGEVAAHNGIHHYETIETKSGVTLDNLSVLALEGGLIVDKKFHESPFTYWNGTQQVTVNGNTVSKAVTNFEYETAENEKKRDIYILKKSYFGRFVEEFKKQSRYSKSSDYVNSNLKNVATI
tara:strand:+ start:389 stop:1063 length:675 start_codon:yes stop_codon:yes gene_type:complete